jgi:hypothetical protein
MKWTPERIRSAERIAGFCLDHGQTILSVAILSACATLFLLGCGAGKDNVVAPPTTTTGTTTGTTVDFNSFPEKLLFTDRISRGAVEISLSVSPNKPLSVIPFQASQVPELHFDADARYTGFGLGGRFAGEFVPYLRMNLQLTNPTTQERTQIDLVPTISLTDGLHYSRNLRLPGLTDSYEAALTVRGPEALTQSGGSENAVAYNSDLTPAGLSGTVVQPSFTATYRSSLVPAQLVPAPATTTTTTGPSTTAPIPTTGGYGQ